MYGLTNFNFLFVFISDILAIVLLYIIWIVAVVILCTFFSHLLHKSCDMCTYLPQVMQVSLYWIFMYGCFKSSLIFFITVHEFIRWYFVKILSQILSIVIWSYLLSNFPSRFSTISFMLLEILIGYSKSFTCHQS